MTHTQRTRLAYLDKQAAINALPRVIEIMKHELGWSDSKCRFEKAKSKEFLATFGGPNIMKLASDDGAGGEDEINDAFLISDAAMNQVFASVDSDQSGDLGMNELLTAVRLLGITQEVRSDEEVILYLETAFPQLKVDLDSIVDLNSVPKKNKVSLDEFKHWWRSVSTLDPAAKSLRKQLFSKYAVTSNKMKGQTGIAFG
jgi:hypothetical protein